jgi:hypothetical protein
VNWQDGNKKSSPPFLRIIRDNCDANIRFDKNNKYFMPFQGTGSVAFCS